MRESVIRLGTRKSKLALWQAEWVAVRLREAGIPCELVTMETKGDKIQNVSIAKIGSKGVFTEELEEKLQSGEIDVAIHSAKDLQSSLPDPFEIIAFSPREVTNDVIVSDREVDLDDDKLVLGTSSTRRGAIFKKYYPHIQLVDMRGNLQTRLEKMRRGDCHGLVLAYAGVHRMGYDDLIRVRLSLDEFIPAVGQGSVAIEAFKGLDPEKRDKIRNAVNDEETEKVLLAERAYLKMMNGGCSIPIYGHASLQGEKIQLKGGIISLDGRQQIIEISEGTDPVSVGKSLADQVLARGGGTILQEIRNQL